LCYQSATQEPKWETYLIGIPDLLNSVTEQEQARFLQRIYKKWLGAERPVELVLKVILSFEQRGELLARLQQRGYQLVSPTTQQAATARA
jgi:hypothetical protein